MISVIFSYTLPAKKSQAAICFSPGFLQKFEEAFGTKPQISKMPILFSIEN